MDRQINESETLTCLRDRTIDHGYVQGILGELFEKSTIMGVGAYRDELMVGYIFGIVKIDAERGRHIWMPYEGVAIMDIGGYLPINSGSGVDVREGRVSDREAVGYQVYYPLEASLIAPEFGIELGVQKVVEAMKARMTSLTSLFAGIILGSCDQGAWPLDHFIKAFLYVRSMPMAPKGAVIRIAITATVKMVLPAATPAVSGIAPIAACTVALGR